MGGDVWSYSGSSMGDLALRDDLHCDHGTIFVSSSPVHTLPSPEHGGDDQSGSVSVY